MDTTCACARIMCARARAHTGRYVLTLCNGRIKDGPTPVKAPHTRRRLTTLFLRPTLVRSVLAVRLSFVVARSLSLSLFLSRQCTSFSHDSCLSLSLPASSPRLTPRQSDRSLARSPRRRTRTLSLTPRPSPRGTLFRLSLSLVLPYPLSAPRYSTIPRPPVPPSVFLSFFDQFFDPI